MKFILEIELNAKVNTDKDVSSVLNSVAEKLYSAEHALFSATAFQFKKPEQNSITDSEGNAVGTWEIKE